MHSLLSPSRSLLSTLQDVADGVLLPKTVRDAKPATSLQKTNLDGRCFQMSLALGYRLKKAGLPAQMVENSLGGADLPVSHSNHCFVRSGSYYLDPSARQFLYFIDSESRTRIERAGKGSYKFFGEVFVFRPGGLRALAENLSGLETLQAAGLTKDSVACYCDVIWGRHERRTTLKELEGFSPPDSTF